jgi:hypothetical protein
MTTIVEWDSIMVYKMEENYNQNSITLNISGHIGASAINFKNIKIEERGDSMYILLYGTILRKNENSSGTFDENIVIKENINNIYFGREKVKIWERKTQNIENNFFYILNKEIIINNGFAGESLTFVKEVDNYYIYRRIFDSGVPYIGVIKYNVRITNLWEINSEQIETISENIIELYINDYIDIFYLDRIVIYINDIRKEIIYIK